MALEDASEPALWMCLAKSLGSGRVVFDSECVTEASRRAPHVHGATRREPRGGDQLLVRTTRVNTEKTEQTPEPVRGLDADASAELGSHPSPQALEQGRGPARWSRPMRRSTSWTARLAQVGGGIPRDQGADEHRQDRAGGVPAPWQQDVRKDGDRLAARLAEIPPDSDDDGPPRHETQHLALIRPMPDDSQAWTGGMRRTATARAGDGTELIDGGQAAGIGEVLDRDGKGA